MNLLIAVVLHSFATDVEGMRDGQLTPRAGASPRDGSSQLLRARTASASNFRLEGTVRMLPGRDEWPRDYSLFCFGKRGWVRSACRAVVRHPLFEILMLIVVAASCVALVADTPRLRLTPDAPLALLLRNLDVYVWPLAFSSEMLLKVGDASTLLSAHPLPFPLCSPPPLSSLLLTSSPLAPHLLSPRSSPPPTPAPPQGHHHRLCVR